jgi:hypothetical protein
MEDPIAAAQRLLDEDGPTFGEPIGLSQPPPPATVYDNHTPAPQYRNPTEYHVPPVVPPNYYNQVPNTLVNNTAGSSWTSIMTYVCAVFIVVLIVYQGVRLSREWNIHNERKQKYNLESYTKYTLALAKRLPAGHITEQKQFEIEPHHLMAYRNASTRGHRRNRTRWLDEDSSESEYNTSSSSEEDEGENIGPGEVDEYPESPVQRRRRRKHKKKTKRIYRRSEYYP